MQMVNEYFDRTYDECKTEYDRQLEMLNQYRRQLEDIHKMMEFEKTQEDNESRIFSPYEEDHFNQENYENLVEEESEVLIQIQELEIEVLNWKSKLAVSYTHLDVYKRQVQGGSGNGSDSGEK